MPLDGNDRSIWQVSVGPTDRSYANQFLKYGVALIGPGYSGPWRPERSDEEFEGGFVRRFASELHAGDVLLLRTGLSTICAVGLVACEYQYLQQFDDVNGWPLQHGRRVRWCPLPEPYDFGRPVFGARLEYRAFMWKTSSFCCDQRPQIPISAYTKIRSPFDELKNDKHRSDMNECVMSTLFLPSNQQPPEPIMPRMGSFDHPSPRRMLL